MNTPILNDLSRRRQELIELFGQTPRIYNREDWRRLLAEYRQHGLDCNVANVEARISAYETILRNEYTPDDADNDFGPWQLREDNEPPWTQRADIAR